MADFTSEFWNWFVIIGTVIGFIWLFWLLRAMTTTPKKPGETVETTGHVWDENLEEFNNPLPRWWLLMFYFTIFFGIIYLILYPGLGSFKGLLGWTQINAYQEEVKTAEETYGPLFNKYANMALSDVAKDTQALQMGERLFASYCTNCHGSDARGARGYPNLRDNDWLYGGDPATIKASILNGRNGIMPPWKASLGDEGVSQVAAYVLSLSGRKVDSAQAAAGKAKYQMFCVGCHQADGTGSMGTPMATVGAPNLTDTTWLYGGSRKAVERSIAGGRSGKMPRHKAFLGEAKSHLIAAYVYSLSQKEANPQ